MLLLKLMEAVLELLLQTITLKLWPSVSKRPHRQRLPL